MAGASGTAAGGAGWIADALNGAGTWRRRGWMPYLLGFLMLFDSWDSIVIAYALPSIVAEWKLSALEAGWLISAGYGGQFAGAILFGTLAEARGRVPVIAAVVAIMGVLAILCALADGYGPLLVLRLLQGTAIGGGLPVATCYINEIAPTRTRGRFFGTFQFIAIGGFGLAAFVSAAVIPAFGWRAMFALGALPLALLPVLLVVPESPRWLAARGRSEDAAGALLRLGSGPVDAPPQSVFDLPPRVPVRALLAPGLRARSVVAGLLWFLTALVSFGLSTWIPSLYVGSFHIPVPEALRYTTLAAVFVFILPFLLRQSIDRIGRRPPVIAGTAIGGVALLLLAFVPVGPTPQVVVLAIIGSIGISIGSMVLWPWTAEAFETHVRAVALGAFSSLARAASMLTPLVVGGLLEVTHSVRPIFLIFAGCSLLVSVLWLRGAEETAGRDVDA